MKILSILIVLILSSNFLFSQTEWEHILDENIDNSKYLIPFEDKFIVFGLFENYRIYDKSFNLLKSENLSNNIISNVTLSSENNLIVSKISQQGSDSKIDIYNLTMNKLSSINFNLTNNIINAVIETDIKSYIIASTNVLNSDAYFSKTENNFELMEDLKLSINGTQQNFNMFLKSFRNKLYIGTNTPSLIESSDSGNSWIKNEGFNSENILEPRGLTITNEFMHIVGLNGKNSISFDEGLTWLAKKPLPISDLRVLSTLEINNTILIIGYDIQSLKGYLISSNDLGNNWNIELETTYKLNDIKIHENKIYVLENNGSIYSIDKSVYSSVESNNMTQSKRVLTNGRLDYQRNFQNKIEILDLNGNIIESNIYNVYDNYIDVENLSKGFYILKEENNYLQFIKYKVYAMKAVLLITISLLYFSSSMNAEEKDDDELFSTVIGINYNYSTENDDAFLGFDLQLKESYKRFIIGFDTGIFYGLESPDDISLFTFRPSLGFYAYGNNKSTFKVIMTVSSGLLVGEDLKNGTTPYGTMSSLGFDVVYKQVGLSFRGNNVNSSVYNNRFGQIGFKFGF